MRRRLLLVSLAALAAAPAAAAAGPAFRLQPAPPAQQASLVYSAAPGGTRTGAVVVTNTGTATGTVRLSITGAAAGRASGGAGAWLTLASHALTLSPEAHVGVGVTLRVPAAAIPGEYLGEIVARTARAGGSSTLTVQVNVASSDTSRGVPWLWIVVAAAIVGAVLLAGLAVALLDRLRPPARMVTIPPPPPAPDRPGAPSD